MTGDRERLELIEFMHQRNEFDYDECQHGTYSGGPSNGEAYAMCERQANGLLAAGYGRIDDGPAVEWGTRWPLSEEAHGPGKFVTYNEDSREAALALIADDREASDSEEDRGVLVWRAAAGPWREGTITETHDKKRAQVKEAEAALKEFAENISLTVRVTDNQRRLAEALRAILEKD
jgi:beta-xylosidase